MPLGVPWKGTKFCQPRGAGELIRGPGHCLGLLEGSPGDFLGRPVPCLGRSLGVLPTSLNVVYVALVTSRV